MELFFLFGISTLMGRRVALSDILGCLVLSAEMYRTTSTANVMGDSRGTVLLVVSREELSKFILKK